MPYLKRNAGSNSICEKRKGPDGKWRAVVLVNLGPCETPEAAVEHYLQIIAESPVVGGDGVIYQNTREAQSRLRSQDQRKQAARDNLVDVLAYMREQGIPIPTATATTPHSHP